jgi:DNA polymerase-3 subunit delta'
MTEAITFLPPQGTETPEADRVAGVPHPREMLSLLAHGGAEHAFLAAYNAGKLHHAFLLTGPLGIGKATFAYRAARFLLAEAEREAEGGGMFGPVTPETLGVSASSRTAQLIAGRAHPDLGVIRRAYDTKTKKTRAEISVDDVRDTLALFEKTAAFGGWRAIIIDAADDLNKEGANAILKTLEEPPKKAVFFLVAHRPEALLPTIRSRCQTIVFDPLPDEALHTLIAAFGGAAGRERDIIVRAEGSIRQALRQRESGVADAMALVERALAALPRVAPADIDRIAERLRNPAEGAEALEDFLSAVERWLHRLIHHRLAAGQGARAVEPLAEGWARMQDRAARVDALNLDRRAFTIAVFEELAALSSPPQP